MADNKKIIIDVETKVDDKDLDKVSSNVEKIGDGADKAKKGLKGMSDSAKKLSTSFKDVAKALGFVELLKTLKDVFMQNQKVADLFATAMGTINIVFNNLVEAIAPVIQKISETTNGFEGLTNILKGSFGLALNTIKLTFNSIGYILTYIQKAWEESPFGNGDPKKIEELNKRLEKFGEKVGEAGNKIVENGKLIGNNLGKALDEVGQVADGVSDAIDKTFSDDKVEKAKKLAEKQVKALKAAKIAMAELEQQVAKYAIEEENLRQTRDDVTKSLKERKDASDKLAKVLVLDRKAQKDLNNLNIEAARLNYQINKSDDNKVALTQAKTKALQSEADVTGKVTEQKMADVAVSREQIDLEKSITKATADRTIKQKEFNQSLMDDNVEKLQQQKKNLEEQQTIELNYLQDNINRYKEGTQARADAEQEYANRKQEIDNQIVATDKAIADKSKAIYKKSLDDTLTALQTNLDLIEKTEFFAFNKKKNLIDKAWKTQKKIIEANYAEERKLAGDNLEALIALAKKYNALLNKNDEDRAQKLRDELGKEIDRYKGYANSLLGIAQDIGGIFDNITNHKLANIQRENDALEKQTTKQESELDRQRAQEDAEIEASNMSQEQKAAAHRDLELRTVAEKNEIEKKKFEIELANFNATEKLKKQAFERNKKFQLAQVIINTAAGIAMALGTMVPPFSFIEAGLIGAAGIAQAAKIMTTQYEGGTPPELNTIYAGAYVPKTDTGGSSGPSAGAVGNLGQQQLQLKEGSLKYQKVFVTETDIRNVTGRVNVIENRSTIR